MVVMLAIGAVFFGKIPREDRTELASGVFTYDRSTILKSTVILPHQFTTTTDLIAMGHLTGTPVEWSMGDYLHVRDLFVIQLTPGESTDWKISKLFFKLNCDQTSSGFQMGNTESFRRDTDGHFSYRTERHVTTFPQYERLMYTETQFEPDILKVDSIDISRLKVTADDALRIAERNGGSAARAEADNRCNIYVTMLGWRGHYWEVEYAFGAGDRKNYTVNVDGETGEVKR
jgi:hypothetical protein